MSKRQVTLTQMNAVLQDMTATMHSGCYNNDTDSADTQGVPETILVTPQAQKRKHIKEKNTLDNPKRNKKNVEENMTQEDELYGDNVKMTKEDEVYNEFEKEEKGDEARRLRVPISSIEDTANQNILHPVFGYTKQWFDKDYITMKRGQVIKRMEWWRAQNKLIFAEADEMYGQKMLNKFWYEAIEETQLVINSIRVFDSIVIHALNRDALASVIGKNKDDGIVHLLYLIIHSTKVTVYKADWYTGFQSATMFEKDGMVYGDVLLVAGKTFVFNRIIHDTED